MKHTIVVEVPDTYYNGAPVDANSVERLLTAEIESTVLESVGRLTAKVIEYHREDVTSGEEHILTYGPDTPREWIERKLDSMEPADSFGIHDVEGDVVIRVTKYSNAHGDDEATFTYVPADGRVRHAGRAEVLEELFPA